MKNFLFQHKNSLSEFVFSSYNSYIFIKLCCCFVKIQLVIYFIIRCGYIFCTRYQSHSVKLLLIFVLLLFHHHHSEDREINAWTIAFSEKGHFYLNIFQKKILSYFRQEHFQSVLPDIGPFLKSRKEHAWSLSTLLYVTLNFISIKFWISVRV